jgi:hypothetical protein
MSRFFPATWLMAALLVSTSRAGPPTGTLQSSRLYTAPDSGSPGGITASLGQINEPLLGVFAIPQYDDVRVYKGSVGADGRSFVLSGLPVAKYDLALVFEHGVYEGLRLSRDPSSLTAADKESIAAAINKSNAFFDTKKIHRCEGVTGRAGRAACVLQEVRTLPVTLQSAEVRADIQVRSVKLAWVEDVGATGWQLLKTREIIRQEIGGNTMKGLLDHRHLPELGGIRVVDGAKDLGLLNLHSF